MLYYHVTCYSPCDSGTNSGHVLASMYMYVHMHMHYTVQKKVTNLCISDQLRRHSYSCLSLLATLLCTCGSVMGTLPHIITWPECGGKEPLDYKLTRLDTCPCLIVTYLALTETMTLLCDRLCFTFNSEFCIVRSDLHIWLVAGTQYYHYSENTKDVKTQLILVQSRNGSIWEGDTEQGTLTEYIHGYLRMTAVTFCCYWINLSRWWWTPLMFPLFLATITFVLLDIHTCSLPNHYCPLQ
jgi:hypothetical protein